MNADDTKLVVGRLGGAYGVKGWLHLQSFTDPPDNLLAYQPWQVELKNGAWKDLAVLAHRKHKKAYIVQLEGIISPEQAREYTGCSVGVHPDALPDLDDDEFYWRDLIGCEVDGYSGDSFGTVASVLETGAHDVLVVRTQDGEEVLIPFVDEFVPEIDLTHRRIRTNWQVDW